MGKVLKWVGIVVGIVIVVIVVGLLVAPRFVDFNRYKPQIEQMVTESTGRAFSIGGNMDLTLFPWAGVSLSDLHLGNAKGFREKDFVSAEHFEVRVKLIPMIFKDFRVKRFILKNPKVALEKSKDGRGNWEDLVKQGEQEQAEEKPAPGGKPALSIRNLVVGEFSITSGEVVWIDHQKGTERRLTEINLGLDGISPDKPIGLRLSARLNGMPVEAEGEMGPLGRPFGEGKIPVRFDVRAMGGLVGKLQGFVTDLRTAPRFNMEIAVEPFPPRKIAETMGVDLSKRVKDPNALREMSLKAMMAGTGESVQLKDGLLKFDDSTLTFDLEAKEFDRPVLTFTLDLDRIDIDRYLPGPVEKTGKETPAEAPTEKSEKKPDYSALRKVVMDGTVRIGELKARGATVSDVKLKIRAKDGIVRVDPFSMDMYEGVLSGRFTLNVQADTPAFETAPVVKNVQAGPLLKDLGYTDKFEGMMNFTADIAARGTEPEEVKRTLNGAGEFAFIDGVIVGFDIAQTIRNVTAALGLADKEKPRTEFSEIKGNFTVKDGLINNPVTYLASPLVRVVGNGTVGLPDETIDYRVEPKFVTTLKGQGDTTLRSGLMVPVKISGTFSNLKFRPDLSGIAESDALKEGASKLLEGLTREKEGEGGIEKEALKLLEGLTTEKGEEGGIGELIPGLLPSKKK
jgi:AsmA protein